MSEERFERIESELGLLRTDVTGLRTDVTGLRADVTGLRTDVTALQTDVTGLRTDVNQLKTGQDDLRREMHVLHEDVIATIQAIPDPMPACERMIKAHVAELREEIGQRLDPLEAIVRKHFGT